MIISDPSAIFYLTGYYHFPWERLYALYLSETGGHKFFLNTLFTVPDDLGVEKVWYADGEDGVKLIADAADHNKPLGIDKDFPARFLLPLMNYNAAASYHVASQCVDRARALKDEEERECMRKASLLNDACMKRLPSMIKEGMTELEAADIVISLYKELGADGTSFTPLIAFGANAAVGHHDPDNTRLKRGDCILVDIGCKKDNFCSDMTRTFFLGEATEHQQEIYNLVLKANLAAEAMIKPGVRFCDIDKTARDIITAGGYGPNFTHRLGHSIGMQDHESGDVSSANTDCVQEGMCFSIEPGIYVEGDTGVRIEDLVIVTKDGCEILNHEPKDLMIL
ncbi:aminopeptidase P family protein [Clostridium sp. AM58-1XD]|nr:aminopeptidase P family protein [Clostridium sp. AM58-1XD]